jgi:hypothetical protein
MKAKYLGLNFANERPKIKDPIKLFISDAGLLQCPDDEIQMNPQITGCE